MHAAKNHGEAVHRLISSAIAMRGGHTIVHVEFLPCLFDQLSQFALESAIEVRDVQGEQLTVLSDFSWPMTLLERWGTS